LLGGTGNDALSGGTGADTFVFDTALNASANVDAISDFVAVDDTIELLQSVFSGLAATGTLGPNGFQAGSSALDASDRIIYDQSTGRIYYDADGLGGVAQVLFATVTPGTALTNADFKIVASSAQAPHAAQLAAEPATSDVVMTSDPVLHDMLGWHTGAALMHSAYLC